MTRRREWRINRVDTAYLASEDDTYVAVPSLADSELVDFVPVELYRAVIGHYAHTRMMATWDRTYNHPAHPEWLQPIDADAVNKAIDELEARLHGDG